VSWRVRSRPVTDPIDADEMEDAITGAARRRVAPDSPCMLCGERPLAVLLRVGYKPGDSVAIPARIPVCESCRSSVRSRDRNRLADRLTTVWEDAGRDVVADTLIARVVEELDITAS
jgi:hypothetical protein